MEAFKSFTSPRRCRLLPASVVLMVWGCQTYEPKPMRLAEYVEAWQERVLDIEPVRDYAQRQLRDDGDTSLFDVSDGLSLREAEAVALHFNPRLRTARAQSGVRLAGARESGWWPDPQFEAEFLRFANRGSRSRFRFDGPSIDGVTLGGPETTPLGIRRVEGDFIDDPWIVGVSVGLTIPLSGRLAVERDLNWSVYDEAWRRVVLAEWETITKLRNLWLEWSTLRGQLAVTQEYVRRLGDVASMADQLARTGEMKVTEARVLRIELSRRIATLQSLEADEEHKRLSLLEMMGVDPRAPVTLNPEVFVGSVTISETPRDQLITAHPRIKMAAARYEVCEQRLRHEIRLQYPDLQLGPAYSLEEGFSRLGFGIGLALPLWNRNRQNIAEAFAEREAARAAAEAEVESVVSEFARARARLRHASLERELLLNRVAPLVERQLADSRALLDLGEVDVLLLRDALTGSLETKLDVLTVTLREARSANELGQMLAPRWMTPRGGASSGATTGGDFDEESP